MEICLNYNIPAKFLVEDGKVLLLPCRELTDKQPKWCNIAQVQLTGVNHNDHHGGKHHHSGGVSTLRYVSHSLSNDLLEIVLRDTQTEMVCHYQFYPNISAIRSWTTVTNISQESVGLDYIASFSMVGLEGNSVWIPYNGWCREVNWRKFSLTDLGLVRDTGTSTNRIHFGNSGAWSTKEYLPMGMLEGQSVCLWQIESSTGWNWEISDKAQMLYMHLSGPTEQEDGWHKELWPGESFTSAPVAVVFADDVDTAFAELTKYRRTIAANALSDKGLPVIFNDYMNCLMADPTTQKELPIIDRAAEAGAEYYVMDAGWYGADSWWDTVGQWEPCAVRFPNGIEEVFDYIRAKGMIPGIWLEIESMGIRCPILDQFDDSSFFTRHGRRVIDHGRYQLDFRSPRVRNFATGVVERLIRDLGVGYIKMDYNIEPGIGTQTDADSFAEGLRQHRLAYLAWVDDICRKHPNLIIENCGSGGMRMDYQMLAHHSLQSTSDQMSCLHTAHIAAAAATAVLPEQAAVWSYPLPTDTDEKIQLNMVNAMLTRIHLAGKIADLSPEQLGIVQEGIAVYKQIRGNIATALPFYPCGLPTYDQKLFCAGYRGKKTYLAVWRLDTKETAITIPVPGCQAQVVYGKARIEDATAGIRVILPRENSAAIIAL